MYFQPWVGSNYEDGFVDGKKVLILGESHYEWQENQILEPTLTCDCIKGQFSGGTTKQFWTNIALSLLGYIPNKDQREEFWNSVAFSNYIQSSVGRGARTRPTKEQWLKGKETFFELLEARQPQIVVVLGYELWGNLPESGVRGKDLTLQPRNRHWAYQLTNGANVYALGFKHPSAGFSGAKHHAIFNEFCTQI
ncbi:hypothetical protein [Enterovibrio norvegicus]|uniref:hypothetical protein n=1 Tax=Enterovibrio norvegicus TaxID=188144 RepID=UPI0013D728A8|nr:hypothetical protein [Enterovibrio norvegicus]